MKLALLAALMAGALLVPSCRAVLPTQAASNVMALGTQVPDITRALSTIKSSDAELAQYLGDKQTVCTFIAPTNSAIFSNAAMLGKFAGKAAQDEAMVRNTLRYHVIPDVALSAEDLGLANRTLTKANQTLYTWADGRNGTLVYFRRDYPIRLNKTDIKAGNCIVHTINMALVPPKYEPQVAAWLDELGTWPPKAPKAEWPPAREPLPGSLETMLKGGGDAAAGGAKASADGGAKAAPAKSSSWGVRPSHLLLAVVAAAAVVALTS